MTIAVDELAGLVKKLNHLFELKFNLQKAINEENYELAAKLRDQIGALERESNIN